MSFVSQSSSLSLLFQDSFVEDIESILNSGTVVDLFEPDEFDALTMDLKNDAYSVGMSDTLVQLREFFYQVGDRRGQPVDVFSSRRSLACACESPRDPLLLSSGEEVSRDLSPAPGSSQLHEHRLVHEMERNVDGPSRGRLSRNSRSEVRRSILDERFRMATLS